MLDAPRACAYPRKTAVAVAQEGLRAKEMMTSHRPYLTPVVILVTLLVGATLTIATMHMEQRIVGARFDRLADLVATRLQQRIAQHMTIIRATRSYFEAAEGSVTAPQFAAYIADISDSRDFRGMQGIGFAPLLPAADAPRAAARIGQDNGAVTPIVPETTSYDQIGPIALLEPHDERNRHALGYDMFSEPLRHAAMTAALETGQPRASAPVELVQEITAAKQPGFLIFLPTSAGLFETFPTRQGGFVYAPFRAGDLHQAVLEELPRTSFALRTHDSAAPQIMLFDNLADDAPGAVTRQIDVAGRNWTLTVAPTAGFRELGDRSAGITVALLSLLLVATVWSTLRSMRQAVDSAEHAAALSAAQAEERTLLLREMQHRIKNHIARIQAIARQTLRSADDLDEFGKVFGARLSAMAKAQDALSRDVWGTADLRQILRGEIGQVMDGERIEAVMRGDDVRLDGRAAQALGLVAHELATNAMKYSGRNDMALTVSWQVVPRGGANWLDLEWVEPEARANAAAASPGGGFGSQLIEALIEGDLQGSFSRSFDDHGMTVRISFPLTAV